MLIQNKIKARPAICKPGFFFVKPLGFIRHNVMGPWPMQLVVPSAVRAAVRMLTMTCRMVFQAPSSSFTSFLLRVGLQLVDADELGPLQELTAGDVLLLGLLRQETDAQPLDVLLRVVLVFRGSSRALDGAVERAEAVDLHLLRVEQHLQQTAAELLQHAVNDVGGVDRAVLRDVVCQLARIQRFETLGAAVPHAVALRLRVVVSFYFIQNLCHSCVFFCFNQRKHSHSADFKRAWSALA